MGKILVFVGCLTAGVCASSAYEVSNIDWKFEGETARESVGSWTGSNLAAMDTVWLAWAWSLPGVIDMGSRGFAFYLR